MSNAPSNNLNAPSRNQIVPDLKIDALKTRVDYLKDCRVIKSEEMDRSEYIPANYQTETVIISHDIHRTDDFVNSKGNKSDAIAIVKVKDVESYLKVNTDAFETTRYAEECRAFIDIDGVCNDDISEEDFNIMDSCITANLINACSDYKIGFMASSSYSIRKKGCPILSYEIVFPEVKGSKLAIKKWVKDEIYNKLKEAIDADAILTIGDTTIDTTKAKLNIDLSVYEKSRKMRMWNSCKTKGDPKTYSRDFNRKIIKANLEERPKVLVEGKLEDTLITYIPKDINYTQLTKVDIEIRGLGNINKSLPSSPTRSVSGVSTASVELTEEQATLVKAINGLDIKRCNNYTEWRNVGWALCNADIPIIYYKEWSMKSHSYKEGCEEQVYNSFRSGERKITQATIWMYLSEDNKTLFKELMPRRKDIFRLVENNCQASCAEIFFNLKPHNYMYLDEQGWYVLNSSNTWDYSKNVPSQLLSDIYKTFNALKIQHEEAILKQQAELDRKEEEEYKKQNEALEEKKKNLGKFIKQCGTAQFGRGITDYLKALYSNTKMFELIDNNPNLFACRNKVYDCRTLKWRDIVPTDYISITTGYDYSPVRNKDIMIDICNFFTSCFKTGDDAMYYLKTIARCLNGNRKGTGEFFYILTGNGGNGKGVSNDLIKRVFGSGDFGYFKVFSATTLTKAQDKANAPEPDIVKSRGRRFVSVSEPESSDTLQGGKLKSLSGGDQQEARDLNKTTISFVPQYGIFIQANNIPRIKLDGGVIRRIRIINFPFDFKENPNPEIPTQKQIDPDLSARLSTDEYRMEFLHLLTDIYETQLADGSFIVDTESVKEATKDYLEKNNPVGVWLGDYYTTMSIKEEVGWHEARDLYNNFKIDTGIEMSEVSFSNLMKIENIAKEKQSTYKNKRNVLLYKGIQRTAVIKTN